MSIKSITRFAALCIICSAAFCSPSYAQDNSSANSSASQTYNDDIWRFKRKVMVGFTTGELDQKARFGGKISSRWGASFTMGRNIYLHKKPIAGFLKIGLNIDGAFNYMNFAKGSGSLSNIIGGNFEDAEEISLGRHYLTAGVAIGPNATFAPFYASQNRKLAALVFRPYFHVVPSFATYMVSDNDDMEMHNAFALWCTAGVEIQWKRLIFGMGWKGCTAKYKGMMDNLMSEFEENYEASGSYKFDTNMFNISIGLAF